MLKESGILDKFRPKEAVTWDIYIAISVVLLFHSIDIGLTYFGVTLGYVREGNPIVREFMERMGIALALFAIWVLGVMVFIGICMASRWLEERRYFFPVPSIFLLLFMIFTAIIKVLTVAWNFHIISG